MADLIKKGLNVVNPLSSDGISELLMGDVGKEKVIGAKDTEYVDFRKTVPITDAEARIDRIRKKKW
jgi:hypothetical protein